MKRNLKLLLALLAALALVAVGCGDDEPTTDASGSGSGSGSEPADLPDGPDVAIGAQDFPESLILSEVYGQALEAAGFTVSIEELGGFRDVVFSSFESGDVNLAPEYVASELEFLNDFAGEATADVDATFAKLQPLLAERDLFAFDPSGAVNQNAFVVTTETAEELDLQTISDLADHAADLTLGAVADCEENAFCLPGLQEVYDIDLSASFTPLDSGLIPEALENGDIDVGTMFSTDGPLASGEFVVLEDDQGLFNADNIFVVASQELVDAYGDALAEVIDAVSAALTTDALIEMNGRFANDREDADVIAADFLEENDLI